MPIVERSFIVRGPWRKDEGKRLHIYSVRVRPLKRYSKPRDFPSPLCTALWANLGAGGDASRRNHRRRSDLKRTPRFVAGLKKSILSNPRTPMNKLARDRHVSSRTVRRAVKHDLGMRSYVRRRRNLLTEKAKEVRRERAPVLLNHLKTRGSHVTVFVDEKNFTVDEVANRQNSRVIAASPAEVPPVLESKHPASVMVFGAVACDGRIMPPSFRTCRTEDRHHRVPGHPGGGPDPLVVAAL